VVQACHRTFTSNKRLGLMLNLILLWALESEHKRKPELHPLLQSQGNLAEDSGAVVGCLINEITLNCGMQSFPLADS